MIGRILYRLARGAAERASSRYRRWLKKQGRFAHLFKPGNEAVLEDIQAYIDHKWEELLKKEECL